MKLKLEKLLTAGFAAAIGASFIAANPAEAQSQWKKIYPEGQNYISYVKGMKRRGNIVSFKSKSYNKSTREINTLNEEANCSEWTKRFRYPHNGKWSAWSETLPETQGGNTVAFVCKY